MVVGDYRGKHYNLRPSHVKARPINAAGRGGCNRLHFRQRVTLLTQPFLSRTEYEGMMSYTNWLRRQVGRLENDIRRHSVFESDAPATVAQLRELRSKAVLHTFMKQQLLRREVPLAQEPDRQVEEYDTQEVVLVRK